MRSAREGLAGFSAAVSLLVAGVLITVAAAWALALTGSWGAAGSEVRPVRIGDTEGRGRRSGARPVRLGAARGSRGTTRRAARRARRAGRTGRPRSRHTSGARRRKGPSGSANAARRPSSSPALRPAHSPERSQATPSPVPANTRIPDVSATIEELVERVPVPVPTGAPGGLLP